MPDQYAALGSAGVGFLGTICRPGCTTITQNGPLRVSAEGPDGEAISNLTNRENDGTGL